MCAAHPSTHATMGVAEGRAYRSHHCLGFWRPMSAATLMAAVAAAIRAAFGFLMRTIARAVMMTVTPTMTALAASSCGRVPCLRGDLVAFVLRLGAVCDITRRWLKQGIAERGAEKAHGDARRCARAVSKRWHGLDSRKHNPAAAA